MQTESNDGIIMKDLKVAVEYCKILFQDASTKNRSHVAEFNGEESKLGFPYRAGKNRAA